MIFTEWQNSEEIFPMFSALYSFILSYHILFKENVINTKICFFYRVCYLRNCISRTSIKRWKFLPNLKLTISVLMITYDKWIKLGFFNMYRIRRCINYCWIIFAYDLSVFESKIGSKRRKFVFWSIQLINNVIAIFILLPSLPWASCHGFHVRNVIAKNLTNLRNHYKHRLSFERCLGILPSPLHIHTYTHWSLKHNLVSIIQHRIFV